VKLLIVDDSLMDRKLNMSILKKAGIENEVLQAVDGEEGMKILSENYKDICLILLDWQMPKMDGIAFMKAVVQVPAVASIPTIMITASTSEENKRLAYDANPRLAGYLTKPYQPNNLLALVRPHLK